MKYLFHLIAILFFLNGVLWPAPASFEKTRAGKTPSDLSMTGFLLWETPKGVLILPAQKPKRFLLSLSTVISVSLADREIQSLTRRNNPPAVMDLFNTVNHIGDKEKLLLGIGAVYAGGWILRKPALRLTAVEMFAASAAAGGLNLVVKQLTGRARPFLNKKQYHFTGVNESADSYRSFSSGHAAITFASAAVLASKTDNPWLKGGIYGTAGLVGAARIYKNKHWFSDVLAGSALGWLSGKLVIKLSEKRLTQKR